MPLTISALARAAADRFGDTPAIVDGDNRLSFAQLYEAARRFAAALMASGIEHEDRVAIWAPNSAEWVVSYLGLSAAGATLVPINTRFKGVEAADILVRSRARALVTVTDFLDTDYVAALRGSGIDLPDLRTVVVAQGPSRDATSTWAEFVGSVSEPDLARVDARADQVIDSDIADIMFTSGTTGVAKGVVQTHRSTLQLAADWAAMTGLHPGDRYLMINPYFHMFGLKAGILPCLAAGATMYPLPVFSVDRAMQMIDDERITVLPGPPTLYQSILDHPARVEHDLSSLRIAVTGAADIPVQLIRRVTDGLSFPTVIVGYGLTEGGTATATSPSDDADTIATTVGHPRPGFELRIVGRDGHDMAPGEVGEVLLRSGTVMSHYLDDPAATAQVLSPDGWLRTGDLGTLDQAGNLRIVGRAKDMFIVGGFNAYPAEIENALLRHPDIQRAAVIGVPEARLGEVGMAFVILKPGSTTTGDDVISWSRDQMANYKVPRRVEVVAELPMNATGKVVKDELRRQASV
jgi:HIP---CoA ligase